jgi:hypothetical protein
MTNEATNDESAATVCWCCGQERSESEEWLRSQGTKPADELR